MNGYAFAPTVDETRAYARNRATETGCRYGVWTCSERPDLWWAAPFCATNNRCYRACGADRVTIYRPAPHA